MKVSPISTVFSKIETKTGIKTVTKHISKPVIGFSTAAASALAAAALIKPKIDTKKIFTENTENKIPLYDIADKLIENKYETDETGIFLKSFKFKDNINLIKKYGSDALNYKYLFRQPVYKNIMEDFRNFVEIGGQKGKELYEKDFDKMFTTFLILKNSKNLNKFKEICSENPEYFKLVENLISNYPDKKTMKSISTYKGKAYKGVAQEMQDSLRKQKDNSNAPISFYVKKHIDNLTSYINTQTLPENIKLYRGENCYTCLTSAKFSNGENVNLGHMMNMASKSGKKEEINKIRELVLDNEISVTVPAFMSTSLTKDTAEDFSKQHISPLIWEFDVEADTKGMFIEGLYASGHFKGQNEVLLQRNSHIVLKDVIYDEKNSVWILKGSVSSQTEL